VRNLSSVLDAGRNRANTGTVSVHHTREGVQMARSAASQRDTSIQTYRSKRDFTATTEPAPSSRPGPSEKHAPMFVVQKHRAHRAGLHWDFRLEHNDVLWSWAVRKGPSLDPADKRIAVHVEDHPLDYADFQGTIPDGHYGAGTVETWDRGTWEPLVDPDEGLRDGEIKFVLDGTRLHGKFTLVRLKPRPNQRGRQDNWLLIKGHDADEKPGFDAETLEAAVAFPPATRRSRAKTDGSAAAQKSETAPDDDKTPQSAAADGKAGGPASGAPTNRRRRSLTIPGAVRGKLPDKQAPQLASVAEDPPEDGDWLTEIKFDGYRIVASLDHGPADQCNVRLLTRNGNNWTNRLPALAQAIGQLYVDSAMVDGELVALDKDGLSSFPALQAALSDGRDQDLVFYLFDLLYLDGWDLRQCALRDRKQRLKGVDTWHDMLRYSDHHEGDAARMRQAACKMKLEGIICKKADAPYRSGRSHDWLKVKCSGREEFLVIGWTEPAGSRTGLGSLHLGYYDPAGRLNYAGGAGTGFSDETLAMLRDRLDVLGSAPPKSLVVAGDDLEHRIHWVKPELVAETSFTAWSGAGRVRHAVFLGLREDKAPKDVVRDPADPQAERRTITPKDYIDSAKRQGPIIAVPPIRPASKAASARAAAARTSSSIVTAKAPKARNETIEGVVLTHPDRALWPGITKRDLVEYWLAVADHALPGLVHRPLAIVRCPEGVDGEHFFQKHGHGTMPSGIRDGVADKAPYLAIDGFQGLVAMAQMSAIELHVWGATEADPLHPDQLVFDLDPGEGVKVPEIVAAALDMREKLEAIGLASFCRTSGGKGLHVVVPLRPEQPWDPVRVFCRSFAETVSEANPEKYLAHVKIADRRGRILIDWLRNGLGSTAVASFCPRARPGAGVATPLAWQEVTPKLDLQAFTLKTVPGRLAKLNTDPWQDFEQSRRALPEAPKREAKPKAASQPAGKATIVTAKAPKRRS
jgi:bifunctional non-homologous end joining protein LigD